MNRLRYRLIRRRARGQAMVELSLLMIVLLPLIFYTLFLDDLFRHRLDLLEAVVSSPWDFGAIDQQENNGQNVDGLERESWCDHTSAYNSHDHSYECDENGSASKDHHKAFAAHACWLVADGQQVTCSIDKNVGAPDLIAIAPAIGYNGGGLTKCSARVGVLNYFIVQKALQSFSKVDMTKDKYYGSTTQGATGDVHSNGTGAASANIFMLEKQEFSLLYDTWATKTPDDIEATFDLLPALQPVKTFKARVQVPYYAAFGLVAGAFDDGQTFFDAAKNDKLINASAEIDGIGDTLLTMHMSFNKDPGHGFGIIKKHYSSAWSDQRVQDTKSAREDHYFGMPTSTW